jgi:excisionase family DNA binding protein
MATTSAPPRRVLHAEPEERPRLAEVLNLLDRLEQSGTPKTRLVGPDGETIELPAAAFKALREVVGAMAQGLTMTLIPRGQELTTQQAADILRVSRPYLVQLLEKGEIPYHKVGTHRRLNSEDVLNYRAKRAEKRRQKLAELTELSEEVGYR